MRITCARVGPRVTPSFASARAPGSSGRLSTPSSRCSVPRRVWWSFRASWSAAATTSRSPSLSGSAPTSVPHRREEDDLADRALPGHQHHEAVDPEPDAAGRRHAVLERGEERLVHRLGLLVALHGVADLRLEARALLLGVV